MMKEGTMHGSPSRGNSTCKGSEAEKAFLKKEKEDWYR